MSGKITVMPFIRKIFSKAYLGGVCVWFLDLLSVMNQEKKSTNLNDNLMLPEMRIHIYAMNKHSFFPKSCMFFDVSICVWQNKRVYFVIPGCVEFVIYTRSIWVGCYSLQLACFFICVCLIPIECLKLYPQYPLPSQEFHNTKHSTKLFEHM